MEALHGQCSHAIHLIFRCVWHMIGICKVFADRITFHAKVYFIRLFLKAACSITFLKAKHYQYIWLTSLKLIINPTSYLNSFYSLISCLWLSHQHQNIWLQIKTVAQVHQRTFAHALDQVMPTLALPIFGWLILCQREMSYILLQCTRYQ